jgi:hypothetical protein
MARVVERHFGGKFSNSCPLDRESLGELSDRLTVAERLDELLYVPTGAMHVRSRRPKPS